MASMEDLNGRNNLNGGDNLKRGDNLNGRFNLDGGEDLDRRDYLDGRVDLRRDGLNGGDDPNDDLTLNSSWELPFGTGR